MLTPEVRARAAGFAAVVSMVSLLARGTPGAASASATRRPAGRMEGQHGAGLKLAVLSRRRAPPCRTARMQDDYPAKGEVRLRRTCDDGQSGERSGRLFVCVWCCCDVVVCSCCDRGQIYCGVELCARQARRQTRCAERATLSDKPGGGVGCMPPGWCGIGRSWRGSDGVAVGMPDAGRLREIVTHHGSPPPAASDLLAGGATAMPRDDADPARPRAGNDAVPLVRSLLPVAAAPRVPAPLRSPSRPCWPRPDESNRHGDRD